MDTDLTLRYRVAPSNFPYSNALLTYTPTITMEKGHRLFVLADVHFNGQCHKGVREAVLREAPVTFLWRNGEGTAAFEHWRRAGCRIDCVGMLNTGFNEFWEAYAYKVGNKARVMKKWAALPEEDRISAMVAIPHYKGFAQRRGIERVYPETYIDQRRWENEF